MDESIGRCEWCGVFDHHRVRGLCEHCNDSFEDYDPAITKKQTDNTLGVEAANVSTINGFNKKGACA